MRAHSSGSHTKLPELKQDQNLYPHGQGRGLLRKMRTGMDKGEGVRKLAKLCGRHLWMVPNMNGYSTLTVDTSMAK